MPRARPLFRAWTICGKVVLCHQKPPTPVPGVRVRAFDADIVQEDSWAPDITGPNGHFRIDYTSATSSARPSRGLAGSGRPDLYFRVESLGGGTLLAEDPARARQSDRENVGHCFCVTLCVDEAPPVTHAWFTHVGDFDINSDISLVTGLTNAAQPAGMPNAHGGPGYGFYDGIYGEGIKLEGDCPSTHPFGGGQPMRYRFRYEDIVNDPGNLHPITANMLTAVDVGVRVVNWDVRDGRRREAADHLGRPDRLGDAAPAAHSARRAARHPMGAGAAGTDETGRQRLGAGRPRVEPARLLGAAALLPHRDGRPGGGAPGDGAGNAVSDPKNGTPLRIRFEAEPVAGPSIGAPTVSNELARIHINNWVEVIELNLQQFMVAGANCCSPIDDNLDILYTADHELMKSWGVGISSCASGLGWSAPALPGGTGPRGGNGTSSHNTSAWPNCSYLVSLSTHRSLTDGEDDALSNGTQLTFCIEH